MWSETLALGQLTANLGYEALSTITPNDEHSWWWSVVWNMECPMKLEILAWLALANKILTWDNGEKRS